MKYTTEQINAAKIKFDAICKDSNMNSNRVEEYFDLQFVVTGKRFVRSPTESNRAFFHLKNFPCELHVNGQVLNGKFNHDDHGVTWDFFNDSTTMSFDADNLSGIMYYENYEPTKIVVNASYPASKEVVTANRALTSACL